MIDTVLDSLSYIVTEAVTSMHDTVFVAGSEAAVDDNSFLSFLENHTVLVSVIIFVLGWILTRFFAWIDNCVKRKNFRKVVVDWIKIISPIEKQLAESLVELSGNMKETDDMLPLRYEMPLTVPDKIKDMSVERMMDSFMYGCYSEETREKRTAHMYNVISIFEYLTRVNDEIRNTYESYNKQTNVLCEKWNNLLDQLRPLLIQYTDSESSGIRFIIRDFDEAYSKMPQSLSIRSIFLDRLQDSIKVGSSEMELVVRMRQIITQIDVFHKKFSEVFSGQANLINQSLITLENAGDYFK